MQHTSSGRCSLSDRLRFLRFLIPAVAEGVGGRGTRRSRLLTFCGAPGHQKGCERGNVVRGCQGLCSLFLSLTQVSCSSEHSSGFFGFLRTCGSARSQLVFRRGLGQLLASITCISCCLNHPVAKLEAPSKSTRPLFLCGMPGRQCGRELGHVVQEY